MNIKNFSEIEINKMRKIIKEFDEEQNKIKYEEAKKKEKQEKEENKEKLKELCHPNGDDISDYVYQYMNITDKVYESDYEPSSYEDAYDKIEEYFDYEFTVQDQKIFLKLINLFNGCYYHGLNKAYIEKEEVAEEN